MIKEGKFLPPFYPVVLGYVLRFWKERFFPVLRTREYDVYVQKLSWYMSYTFRYELFTHFVKYFYGYVQYLLSKEELKPLLKPFLVSDLSLYFLYKDPKETLKFFVENVFPNFLNSLSYIPPDFFDFGIERNKLVEAIRKVFLRVMRFPSLRSFTFRFETKEPYFVKYSEQLKKLKYENILFFSTNTFFN